MMGYKLSVGEYRWVEDEEFDSMSQILMDLEKSKKQFNNDADFGVIISCDIMVPSSKLDHEELNELPYLIEKVKVKNVTRLVPTLHNKRDFIGHVLMLQQAQERGYKITKVNKILHFRQSYWMSDFIKKIVAKRLAAKTPFEQYLKKLESNSNYGKLLQKPEQLELKIVSSYFIPGRGNHNYAAKFLKSPLFKSFQIINPNFVIIEMHKAKVELRSLIAAGVCVLDISLRNVL